MQWDGVTLRGRVALGALVLVNCGGSQVEQGTAEPQRPAEPVSPVFHPGSRLEVRYLDAGGGAVEFLGLHDTKLDFDCSFLPGVDGKEHCLPETPPTFYFSDAACTRPAGAFPGCTSNLGWFAVAVVENPGDMCNPGGAYEMYKVGEKVDASALYWMQAGECRPDPHPDWDAFALEAAPLDDFVSARRSVGVQSGSLAARTLEADDGTVLVTGLFDVEHLRDCYLPGPDTAACVPGAQGATQSTAFYGDAACTEQLAYINQCNFPTFAVGYDCGRTSIRSIADSAEGGVYRGGPSNCSLDPAPLGGLLYFHIGANIDGDFPQVEELRRGTGRLRARYRSKDGVPLAAMKGFFDTHTNAPCVAENFGDGVLRCAPVPPTPVLGESYADAQCSQRLVPWNRGTADCPRDKPSLLKETQVEACEVVTSIFESGDDYTGDVYHPLNGECVPMPQHAGVSFSMAAKIVDPTTFPELTERTE